MGSSGGSDDCKVIYVIPYLVMKMMQFLNKVTILQAKVIRMVRSDNTESEDEVIVASMNYFFIK